MKICEFDFHESETRGMHLESAYPTVYTVSIEKTYINMVVLIRPLTAGSSCSPSADEVRDNLDHLTRTLNRIGGKAKKRIQIYSRKIVV
jgi:hypothetical protein